MLSMAWIVRHFCVQSSLLLGSSVLEKSFDTILQHFYSEFTLAERYQKADRILSSSTEELSQLKKDAKGNHGLLPGF